MNFEPLLAKLSVESADFTGAGAGGGIAGGASVSFDLSIRSGVDFIIETLGVTEKIASSDLSH